jgi:hypothetical protein
MSKACADKCRSENVSCQNNECRNWIDYGDDLNCTIIAAEENGPMTLEEVSKRLNLSLVRIKQIEEKALKTLSKRVDKDILYE